MAEHKYRWRYPNGRASWTYETLEVAESQGENLRKQHPLITLEQSFDNGETWVSAVPALLARVRELEAEVERQREINRRAELQTQGVEAERDAALSTIAKVEALHHKITRYGNDMYSISSESYEEEPTSYEDMEPFDICAECYAVEELICEECGGDAPVGHRSNWPCPTARALGSVPSTGEGNE